MRTHLDERGWLKKNKINFRELFLNLAGKRNPTDAGQHKVHHQSSWQTRTTHGQRFISF